MATKFYLAEIPDDFPATNVKFENMTKPLLAIPPKMVDGKPITIVGYINADSNDVAWLSASKDTATQVTAEVDSFYTLTVPEEITLSGTDGTGIKTGTISVTLTGDIPLKGTVQVKTTATPLQAKGSVDVPMTIATPKVEWNRTEMLGDGTSSDYSVSAVLAPGDWTGTVTFECLVQ